MTGPTSTISLAQLAFEQGLRCERDPNIAAVGYGIKLRAGQPAGPEAVVFFVREKLRDEAALLERGTFSVPRSLEGFATDVVEVGHLAISAADRRSPAGARGSRVAEPLVGGATTTTLGTTVSGPAGYGTLGAQCFDSLSKAPLVLSNAHVWGTTVGVEVVQPVTPSALLGASVVPATTGSAPSMVLSRVPSGLVPPVVFANSVGQTYLITGSETDPLPTGQTSAPPTSGTRTVSEQVSVAASNAGLPPAGQRLAPTVTWSYRRVSDTAVLQSSVTAARPVSKLLTARRLFSNAASYSSGQTATLYAEVIPAAGGTPAVATAHLPLVLLYPVSTGDKFLPRLLRPTTRQPVTTVTASFSGFPAPARAGVAALPAFAGSGAFGVDSQQNGTFITPPGGSGLPAGTFVLTLPSGDVRLFVPIGTQVIVDINLSGSTGPLAIAALNSARDTVANTFTTAPGTGGRTLVTVQASEIVELVLTGVANAQLFGVTAKRLSPEASAPLAYTGTVAASDLLPKGKWGACLFVQDLATGLTESANMVEMAIGLSGLVTDCTFDVT